MCAASYMKQRRPLFVAEVAAAGTRFQKVIRSTEVVKANLMHICDKLASFTSYCRKIAPWFPSVVLFRGLAEI